MKSIVVVGAQWGDEGKGKVVDYMAPSFEYVARCAGGHNAGHTVIYDEHKFVLQLIPCGMLRPGVHAVIGTGWWSILLHSWRSSIAWRAAVSM